MKLSCFSFLRSRLGQEGPATSTDIYARRMDAKALKLSQAMNKSLQEENSALQHEVQMMMREIQKLRSQVNSHCFHKFVRLAPNLTACEQSSSTPTHFEAADLMPRAQSLPSGFTPSLKRPTSTSAPTHSVTSSSLVTPGGLPPFRVKSMSVSSSSSSAVPPVGPRSLKLWKEDDSLLILSQDHVPHVSSSNDADEAPRVPAWMRSEAALSPERDNRLAQHRQIMLLPRQDCTFFNGVENPLPTTTTIKKVSISESMERPRLLDRSRSSGSKGSRGSSRSRQDSESKQRDEHPLEPSFSSNCQTQHTAQERK